MKKKAIVLALIVLLFCPSLVVAEETGKPIWDTAIGSRVVSTSITADGDLVAAGNLDRGGAALFDREGTELWSYPTGCPVYQVSLSDDGNLLAVASDKVRVLNRNGKIVTQVEDDYYAYATAISGDGKYVAAGYDNNQVVLLTADGKRRWTQVLDDDPKALALSYNGSVLAAGGKDALVSVFDTQGTPLWTFDTGRAVTSLSVSPEGDYVAAGSLNYFAYLFDRNGTVLWKYNTHERVYGVAVSADGKYVAASSGNTVTLLTRAGDVVRTYDLGCQAFGTAITPDGAKIAVGTGSGGEGVVLLSGVEETPTQKEDVSENVSSSQDPKNMAAAGETEGAGDAYLLKSFVLDGTDSVPEIAHGFDGVAVAGIVRHDNDTGSLVAVRMTVGQDWADAHGGSGNICIVTVSPDNMGQFPLRAEVLKTTFIGYDPEDNLVFEGDSPYPVTKYGLMAVEDGADTASGWEEELPLSDLTWRKGYDNVTESAPVGNDTRGNDSEAAETDGNSTTGPGTFPTLPLQIPRQPSFAE